jgi:hypothetical protein
MPHGELCWQCGGIGSRSARKAAASGISFESRSMRFPWIAPDVGPDNADSAYAMLEHRPGFWKNVR